MFPQHYVPLWGGGGKVALLCVRKLAATSDARLDCHTVCSVTPWPLDAPGHLVGLREQKFQGQVSVREQRGRRSSGAVTLKESPW